MSMEVHNVKYNEVNKLLGDIYSKYININNSADARTPFIKDTILKISDSDIKDVNFGQETAGGNYKIDKTSFTDLIKELIYCKIGNIDVDLNMPIDNTHRTKGYLKFVKSKANRVTGELAIEKNKQIRNNILCSMNLVNVFIDILDAYNNFLNDNANLEHLKKKVNNIVIVNKNAKKYADRSKGSANHGYWIESGTEANEVAISSLYLSINSYSGDANTNNLFRHFIVNYDATIGVVSDPLDTYNHSNEITNVLSGLFNADLKIINNNVPPTPTNIITGIVINVPPDGRPVIKKDKNAANPVNDIILNDIDNTIISNANLYKALLERDRRLFQDFLNLIINLDLVNRRTQIKALLTYFKVIKEYFYIALTSGNLLFNSYFKKIQLLGNTPVEGDFAIAEGYAEGYAIKYLNKDQILMESHQIYTDGNTTLTDNNEIINISSSVSDYYEKSYFGRAKKENDDNYMNKIIENISKLQVSGAQSANISNSDSEYISNYGFVAIVENSNTIKIKSRYSLLDDLLKRSAPGTKLSNVIHISTPDRSIEKSNISSSNDSFKMSDLTTGSQMPDKVKNFINNLDANNLSKNYIININNTSYPIKKIITDSSKTYVEFLISARLIYPTQSSKELNDVPILTLPYDKVTLFDSDNVYLGTGNTEARNAVPERFFKSFDDAKGSKILFHKLDSSSSVPGVDNKVKLTIKKPLDYKTGYINNIDSIKSINYSINANESRIKNARTIYDLNKSKNDVLYYQLISYIVILVGIIVTLILTNTMNMDKPTTKLVASVCLGIVVLQFVTYYILSVLYVEAFTTENIIEKFSQRTYQLPIIIEDATMEFTSTNDSKYPEQKVEYVQNQLILLNNKIIQALELSNVGIGQASSSDAYIKLLNITEFERVSRGNINNILTVQSDGSKIHIDLLKYSTAVHVVNIKTVLMLSLAIVGLFTINVYTDGKYMENLAFVGGFILIIILAYYLIYSNSVVRTRSNNVYWGKEHKTDYSDI